MANALRRWRLPLITGVGIWLLSFPLLTWHPAAASHPVQAASLAAWNAEAGDHRLVRQLDRESRAALEAARASDRGWDRVVLETATREALERERPDFRYETLHLVLVDDRPGTEEDRALMGAIGDEGELRIMLIRRGNIWEGQLIA